MRFLSKQQPAASPEELVILRTNPLAQFPASIGASEPLWDYRHALAPRMKTWVVYTLGAAGIFAVVPEDEARIICEDVATEQLQRPLHLKNEAELLKEAVRDVLAAREALYRHDAYLDETGGAA